MKIAVLTPLPPVRSGIAGYSALLLPALARRAEVTAVVNQEDFEPIPGVPVLTIGELRPRRAEFDHVVGQLGNNPYHEFVWAEAMEHPLHAVLHDLVLHHLVVERTLARGKAEEYEALLRESDGELGAAFARGRAAGLHAELGNFLFPASAELARRSRGVIVHDRWAADQLRERGVEVPIVVVGHPYDEAAPIPTDEEREALRRRLGYGETDRVIGMFGFVTSTKRPEVVFEAFAAAARRDPALRLLIVGQPAPNVDLAALASRYGVPAERWSATGWVADEEFDRYLAAVDRVVNLRYPSAGEMSGTLVRALRVGRPVAVSELGQFAELPREIVTRIPLDATETDALAAFMTSGLESGPLAEAGRAWLEAHGALDRVVDGYLRALGGADEVPRAGAAVPRAMPLLPRIAVSRLDARPAPAGWSLSMTLRNEGDALHRAAVFGEPSLRLIVKMFRRERVVADRWLALAGDLAPGASADLETALAAPPDADRVAIWTAMSEIPYLDGPPIADLAL
ncbi:MAG TPA: glycosyltransferase [Thermoanaerobaculia bacterium]|nr:glycosyltransferase [Thermoanaerobaculia bacterium]